MTKNEITLAGLKIDAIDKEEFLNDSLNRIIAGRKTFVSTPYSEFLFYCFNDPKLFDLFNSADISLPDGIGIFWAKRYLDLRLTAKSYSGKIWQSFGQLIYSSLAIIFNPKWIKTALPEKMVGADLIWDLAELAEKNNFSIYLLGGFAETPKVAAGKLKASFNGLNIAGYSNKNPQDQSIIDDINRVKPEILLVAFGPIKQEQWIKENLNRLDVKLAMGVGGSFDYIAGIRSAPPKFIRYSGLEWLWRLITQPQRAGRIFNATFGLMSQLWHYKVFQSLPLRPNVAVIILNEKNEVLICRRNPKNFHQDIITNSQSLKAQNYWQFPQGGVDRGESIEQAAKREAFEETNLKNLELLKISEKTNTYVWNNSLRKFEKNKKYQNKGQMQNIAYFKYSKQEKVKIDNKEFVEYQWVPVQKLSPIILPERAALTDIVLEDLKDLA